jgi:hypothetical protein
VRLACSGVPRRRGQAPWSHAVGVGHCPQPAVHGSSAQLDKRPTVGRSRAAQRRLGLTAKASFRRPVLCGDAPARMRGGGRSGREPCLSPKVRICAPSTVWRCDPRGRRSSFRAEAGTGVARFRASTDRTPDRDARGARPGPRDRFHPPRRGRTARALRRRRARSPCRRLTTASPLSGRTRRLGAGPRYPSGDVGAARGRRRRRIGTPRWDR